jgi:hypothetical protein
LFVENILIIIGPNSPVWVLAMLRIACCDGYSFAFLVKSLENMHILYNSSRRE